MMQANPITLVSLSESRSSSFEELFSFSNQCVENLIVATAYFDLVSLQEIVSLALKEKPKKGKARVSIFVDGSASRFKSDPDIRNALCTLSKLLTQQCDRNSGIFLVNFGTLFHTKLYFLESTKKIKLFIGSLNLSQNGLKKNEEILVDLSQSINSDVYEQIFSYAKILHEKSIEVSRAIGLKKYNPNLRDIILDGHIYYETKRNDPFRFKLGLPDEFLAQKTDIDPLLDATIVDSISLKRLLSQSIPFGLNLSFLQTENIRANSHWKRFCVETCYGFWTPSCYQDLIKRELKIKSSKNDPYYQELLNQIKFNYHIVEGCFLLFCRRVSGKIKEFRSQSQGYKNIYWKYENISIARSDWKNWIDNLQHKLSNEDFYNALVIGVSKTKAPDVWADPLVSSEFENSFLGFICFGMAQRSLNRTGNSNVLIKEISKSLHISGHIDIDDMKKYIENAGFLFGKEDVDNLTLQFSEENYLA